MEILWLRSEYGVLMHFVTFSQLRTIQYAGIRHNDAVVPYFDIIFNVSERLNGDILTDFCPGGYRC